MKADFVEYIVEPKTQTKQNIQKNKPYISIQQSLDGMFFVVARTFTGARFYGDTVKSLEAGYKIFKDYCSVVLYFGGGEVELFAVVNDGYDLIRREVV